MTIAVTPDGRVLVNFIQHGIRYGNIVHANKEAKTLKDKHYPAAALVLQPETETAE